MGDSESKNWPKEIDISEVVSEKTEQETKDVKKLLDLWSGKHEMSKKEMVQLLSSLAESTILAKAIPDLLDQILKKYDFANTIKLAFYIAEDLGYESMAGQATLNKILDLSAGSKKTEWEMTIAHEAIIDVFERSLMGSELELKAKAMVPTTEPHSSLLAGVELEKYGYPMQITDQPQDP
ncbi:MAG: hypothetical protein OEY94_05840 [Alphaproteobacteria bacterium]|nr:hypothetical protein [Alphaproteobacteria bacterium]